MGALEERVLAGHQQLLAVTRENIRYMVLKRLRRIIIILYLICFCNTRYITACQWVKIYSDLQIRIAMYILIMNIYGYHYANSLVILSLFLATFMLMSIELRR